MNIHCVHACVRVCVRVYLYDVLSMIIYVCLLLLIFVENILWEYMQYVFNFIPVEDLRVQVL
jgi:hypothetical protein